MTRHTIKLLTDLEVKNAPLKDAAYKIKDMPGLYLQVNPTGSRIWLLRYRNPKTKKETMYTIGTFPDVKCASARHAAEEAKALVRQGIDPNTKKQRDKLRGNGKTFQEIALEWQENQLGRWKATNAEQVRRSLELDVFPFIGNSSISELEAVDVMAILRKIEARGALPQAQKVRQRINAVFRFAVLTGQLKGNPLPENMRGAIKAYKEKHFNAVTLEDLPEFLKDLAAYRSEVMRRAVQFTLLTFARTGSVRLAEWQEIDWENAVWRIPAEHMKMEQPHVIPLSRQALKLLEDLRPFTGNSRLIFYTINKNKNLSPNALLQVIRRIGWNDATTIHGFRAIASSTLKEQGFREKVVEKQLAHQGRDKVENAYDYMAQYMDERKQMMQWWADFLDEQQHGYGKVIIANFAKAKMQNC